MAARTAPGHRSLPDGCSPRLERLREEMAKAGADLVVLSSMENMAYFCGWAEEGHERFLGLIVSRSSAVLLVPALNAESAAANPAGIRVLAHSDADDWLEVLRTWHLREIDRPARDVMIDPKLAARHLLSMQPRLQTASWRDAGHLVATLRQHKGPEEIEALQRAARLIDAICVDVAAGLAPGVTESETAARVQTAIAAAGSSPAFAPIVCFGPNSARPHHEPGNAALREGDIVLIDIGCTFSGYVSDITRTMSFGPPADKEAQAVYRTVYDAHTAAFDAAGPERTGAEIDAAARTVIETAGYGEYFIHRTGHGVGLDEHEPPYITAQNQEPLGSFACFSIEPGVYLPDRFGIRLENLVVTTEDGSFSLNRPIESNLPILNPHSKKPRTAARRRNSPSGG